MADSRKINPFPGFAILEPHELKRKVGTYELPAEDSENSPQIGKIIDIGKVPAEITAKIKEWKLTEKEAAEFLATYRPFEVGMVVAYKKYQDFPIQLGTKKYIAVGFEHLLFEVEEV
jgi:co-chaperonin GroES (HSP10)